MAFDAVFAVMPYNKIGAILKSLAAIYAPLVVLVGNNMRPAEMREIILRETVCEKDVLFGFQATAGKRDSATSSQQSNKQQYQANNVKLRQTH